MTREELRKIFDDAEKKICTPENYSKVFAELTDSGKKPPENPEQFSIRVNRILDREIVFEVLAQALAQNRQGSGHRDCTKHSD